MKRFEILGDGWVLQENEYGRVLLRGPTDYDGLRKFVFEPYRVWERLNHKHICPVCSYVWESRDMSRPPVSCAACKSYAISRRREPVPDPGAGRRWENVKDYLDFIH